MTKPFLRQLIEERVESRGDSNFLTFGEQRYSYLEIDRYSNQVANALRELGVKSNDRAAIFLPNSTEFIYSWFATIKLNATMVPLNTQLKGEALRYIVGHVEPHLIITNFNLLKELELVVEVLPDYCKIVIVSPDGAASYNLGRNDIEVFDYHTLVSQASTARLPDVKVNAEDTAIIIYTSGTTGYPKGVMINRRAQTNHPLYYHPELIKTVPDQIAYTYLPLFHVTSQGVTMGSFIGGARLALDTEFNVFGFWERIRRHNAVVFPYLGAVISMLYARPPRPDDSNNPATHALGAAAPKDIWAAFERRFGVQLLETYGQTEWKGIWTMHPIVNGVVQSRIGAAGVAPARAQIKIVDDNDQELPPGQPGQIIMKPAEAGIMMSGYYRQPELNARVFKDGWYYTGDMGEIDADGYLYFKGRLKDYIRRRGENISAFEIERVVNLHPGVLESAAVGVPSTFSEEEVKLCVVFKPEVTAETQPAPAELWRYCRENLPAFMVPRYIEILPELPHTPTQRIRKFLLAETGTKGAWDRKAH